MAVKKVRFIRNRRPNRVNITVLGTRFGLDRRGARGDTAGVPSEAFDDHNFNRNIKAGLIEEITESEFKTLGDREEDEPQGRLKPPPRVHFDLPQDANKLTIIENFPREWMSPSLEFANATDRVDEMVAQIIEATGVDEATARQMVSVLNKEPVEGEEVTDG